jgi:hypothetical protein
MMGSHVKSQYPPERAHRQRAEISGRVQAQPTEAPVPYDRYSPGSGAPKSRRLYAEMH